MIVFIDNGHGKGTPGKRSPIWSDGSQLFEWEFNRDIAKLLFIKLKVSGVDCRLIVPEEEDVSLEERCRRVNALHKVNKGVLVSIHANAGGGTGWEVFTSKGETESDKIVPFFIEAAKRNVKDFNIRADYSDGDGDKEENFYILKNTNCPAILTENLFMDTEKDCRYIMSTKGRESIINLHYEAILSYVKSKNIL